MKIYFGHKANDNAKISPSLLDRGVHLFRASPREIHAVGLYRLQQPGFVSYMMALPAFMQANDLNKDISLSAPGYSLAIKQEHLMPIVFPKVFIKAKKGKTITYRGEHEEYMSRSDGTTYLANFDRALLGFSVSNQIERTAYAPAPFVRICDVPAMVTIARIASSFIRVHRYPAFSDDTHYEEIAWEPIYRKRNLEPDEDAMDGNKRRVLESTTASEGIIQGFSVKDTTVTKGKETQKIVFTIARPGKATNLMWGSPSDIPQTHGIHFPFVDELSKIDKDTVPAVIERFFIRSLGRTTEDCLRNYSDVVTAWKTSICSTLWGRQMSHLFRVIEIALPAQARPFPIIDSGIYCGAYLSGAGFSVGMGKDVYRPDPYATNFAETSCYGTNETLIEEIVAAAGIELESEAATEFRDAAKKGIRELADHIQKNLAISVQRQEAVAKLCLQIRTSTPYRVPNIHGLIWAMNGIKGGSPPELDEPMYPLHLFRTDIFAMYLSAFGPLSPSPEMPGGSVMKLDETGTLPDGFNKVLAVRLVSLETAISDWKKVLGEGFMHNGFGNLSSPYEYAAITGKDAKQNWFSGLCEFSKWYKKNGRAAKGKEVSDVTEGSGVHWDLIEGGLDFADF